jgi:hypothetical protein
MELTPFNYRALGLQHLLGTGLLAGLTLLFSLRYPDPRFNREFRWTLALLGLAALAAIPLFRGERPGKLAFAPLVLFVAALLSFLVYVGRTAAGRLRDQRERRRRGPKLH